MDLDYQAIIFVLGLMGTVFTVYNYFKNPQIKLEKQDLLVGERISDLGKQLSNLRDNHLHTIEVKMDTHISNQAINERETAMMLTRLQTILEERLPLKK